MVLKVQISVEKDVRDRLSVAKQTLNKTWDDFLPFLLDFYIKHAGEDGENIRDYEYEKYYLGDALPDSASRHHQELSNVLTELENTFKSTDDARDKAFIGEKIARINAILKDVATDVESNRLTEEIAQIKQNRLKILKNIAPSERVLIKDPLKKYETKRKEVEDSNDQEQKD